ncbi:MAG: BamA/TamA family outer membrane protein [Marinovum sp.]|nr:BamA/TamA family outer membrane protein [Marinovum sp.]
MFKPHQKATRPIALAPYQLAFVGLLCAFIGNGALAQTLSISTDDGDLKTLLEGASVSLESAEDRPVTDVIAAAQGDYERLLAVLYEDGFFAPSVSITLAGTEASGLSVLRPPTIVRPVVINIDVGPRFRFGRAEISPLAPGTKPPDTFATGARASTAPIRAAATQSIKAWRAASHAKAEISELLITANHAERTLNVLIRVDPGPALTFGALIPPGDSAVRDKRLVAIAGLATREPFSPDAVQQARERLLATGAFRSVVIEEAKTRNAAGQLDMILNVEDAAPRRLGFGAEVFSDEGLSLQAFWMHRNAFGGGERLRFDGEVSGIGGTTGGLDYALGASLSIPGFRRADDTLTLEANIAHEDEPTFTSDLGTFFLRRERKFEDARNISTGIGVRYSNSETLYGQQEFTHVMLSIRGTWDSRDDQFAPTEGFFAAAELQPFIGINGSVSGLKTDIDGRVYRSVGDRTILASRLQIGSVIGPELSETPPQFLCLSGGGGTVRGQAYQDLGVVTSRGISGGRSFMGLSTEIRQSLTDALGFVAFWDHGLVSAESDFSDAKDHSGFGIGARYRTGFGPLRVDLGLPNDATDARDLHIYIGLGEAF